MLQCASRFEGFWNNRRFSASRACEISGWVGKAGTVTENLPSARYGAGSFPPQDLEPIKVRLVK